MHRSSIVDHVWQCSEPAKQGLPRKVTVEFCVYHDNGRVRIYPVRTFAGLTTGHARDRARRWINGVLLEEDRA